MCEKCERLDTAISRYRRFIAGGLLEPLSTERIKALIQELQEQRSDAALRRQSPVHIALFWIDGDLDRRQNCSMGQAERPTCPDCGAFLILALPPGGKGQRTFQCMDCDRPDPIKSDALRWLSSELKPPQ
jgi:hypothetical protein